MSRPYLCDCHECEMWPTPLAAHFYDRGMTTEGIAEQATIERLTIQEAHAYLAGVSAARNAFYREVGQ